MSFRFGLTGKVLNQLIFLLTKNTDSWFVQPENWIIQSSLRGFSNDVTMSQLIPTFVFCCCCSESETPRLIETDAGKNDWPRFTDTTFFGHKFGLTRCSSRIHFLLPRSKRTPQLLEAWKERKNKKLKIGWWKVGQLSWKYGSHETSLSKLFITYHCKLVTDQCSARSILTN